MYGRSQAPPPPGRRNPPPLMHPYPGIPHHGLQPIARVPAGYAAYPQPIPQLQPRPMPIPLPPPHHRFPPAQIMHRVPPRPPPMMPIGHPHIMMRHPLLPGQPPLQGRPPPALMGYRAIANPTRVYRRPPPKPQGPHKAIAKKPTKKPTPVTVKRSEPKKPIEPAAVVNADDTEVLRLLDVVDEEKGGTAAAKAREEAQDGPAPDNVAAGEEGGEVERLLDLVDEESTPVKKAAGEAEQSAVVHGEEAVPEQEVAQEDKVEPHQAASGPDRKPAVDKKELMKLKVVELRKMCTGEGLSVSGKKAQLVARLVEHSKS